MRADIFTLHHLSPSTKKSKHPLNPLTRKRIIIVFFIKMFFYYYSDWGNFSWFCQMKKKKHILFRRFKTVKNRSCSIKLDKCQVQKRHLYPLISTGRLCLSPLRHSVIFFCVFFLLILNILCSPFAGFRSTPSPSPYATALLPLNHGHSNGGLATTESVYAKPESVCPSRVSYYASSQLTQVCVP